MTCLFFVLRPSQDPRWEQIRQPPPLLGGLSGRSRKRPESAHSVLVADFSPTLQSLQVKGRKAKPTEETCGIAPKSQSKPASAASEVQETLPNNFNLEGPIDYLRAGKTEVREGYRCASFDVGM